MAGISVNVHGAKVRDAGCLNVITLQSGHAYDEITLFFETPEDAEEIADAIYNAAKRMRGEKNNG